MLLWSRLFCNILSWNLGKRQLWLWCKFFDEIKALDRKWGGGYICQKIENSNSDGNTAFDYTVKPRFTGPLGGKELGPVNWEAWYILVHFTLIYTQSLFSGIESGPGKLRDPVNRGTVNRGFTVFCYMAPLSQYSNFYFCEEAEREN